jgi:hypothetical protein
MGQHADDYNNIQADSLEDLTDYESGKISRLEAIERGILNERGEIEGTDTTWGSMIMKASYKRSTVART